MEILSELPEDLQRGLNRAADLLCDARHVLAISHIDADGITSLAIVVSLLRRSKIPHIWRNIHQLNSETITEVAELLRENHSDVVIFSDLGTGQRALIEKMRRQFESVRGIIILDHHLPQSGGNGQSGEEDAGDRMRGEAERRSDIVEINPHLHGMDGSFDVSAAGVAFLLALTMDRRNVDLSELAVVGATGDLQRYYGRGLVGTNKRIAEIGERAGVLLRKRDLTFFGINTRPLPFLLEYCTEPYLPGLTGNRDACMSFFEERDIPLKDDEDKWRMWTDLSPDEKKRAVQGLVGVILEAGYPPSVAQNIIGEVVELLRRPQRSEMRIAKEFATLLNACGRNSRPEIGVRICLGDEEAYSAGRSLLQVHRQNLSSALRRLEENGYEETDGMYIVRDPETPDTIVGIVIGMAQGSKIVPSDRPVIGIATRTSDEGPFVKISGRAHKDLVRKGVNLKEVFVSVARAMNDRHGQLVVEAGGHPMAAGAFVRDEYLDEFLERVSSLLEKTLAKPKNKR